MATNGDAIIARANEIANEILPAPRPITNAMLFPGAIIAQDTSARPQYMRIVRIDLHGCLVCNKANADKDIVRIQPCFFNRYLLHCDTIGKAEFAALEKALRCYCSIAKPAVKQIYAPQALALALREEQIRKYSRVTMVREFARRLIERYAIENPQKAQTAPIEAEAPAKRINIVHKLKCWAEHFNAILDGTKTFEYRVFDRDYAVGDKLLLQEYDMKTGYTGRECLVLVTSMLINFPEGVPIGENNCIMSVKLQDTGELDTRGAIKRLDSIEAELKDIRNFVEGWL